MIKQHIESVEPNNVQKYSAQYSSFGNDYVYARVTKTARFAEFPRSNMRIGTLSIVMCLKGEADICVNMVDYHLEPGTLIVFGSDSVFNVSNIDWDNIDAYMLLISPDFLRDINFEINVLTTIGLAPNNHPHVKLNSEEMDLLSRYFELIHFNTIENRNARYVKTIARSLIGSTVYQVMQVIENHQQTKATPAMSRRAKYIKDFMTLLTRYHHHERSVAFYAQQLSISPKYLSMIIREGTGRSAAEWIDDYVITEAKNLLKFSGKNIQQVAYELNFTNQSSFGKYFKHITGMSPTKFQRS